MVHFSKNDLMSVGIFFVACNEHSTG